MITAPLLLQLLQRKNRTIRLHKKLSTADKKIVIAVVNGELTAKRFRTINGQAVLMPENEEFNAIELTDGTDCEIWGVVVHVVHSL